jgi:hypothetical protein
LTVLTGSAVGSSTKFGTTDSFLAADTLAEIVIDNGTIGILKVNAIVDISRTKDYSSLVLIVDDPDFDNLIQIRNQHGSKVTVVLGEPQITFSLIKSVMKRRGIMGRKMYQRDPIWILPQRFAADLNQYRHFSSRCP